MFLHEFFSKNDTNSNLALHKPYAYAPSKASTNTSNTVSA